MVSEYEFLSFAFIVGALAFLNPCGFAMLPAYVAYSLGTADEERQRTARLAWGLRVLRGLKIGLTVSAGFFTVLLSAGLIFSLIGTSIAQYLPWVAGFLGAGLIVLGGLMLAGRAPFLSMPHLAVPKAQPGRLLTFYLYGVSYAVAAVGCTIPLFLVVLFQAFSFSTSVLVGVANFAAYAAGMTILMLALSVAVAFSKGLITRYLIPALRYVNALSAVVLIGAGGYLIYYQLLRSGIVARILGVALP